MSESGKVVVTKTKLDELANRINEKAGSTGPKTIAELTQTVANMPAGVIPEIGANGNWYIDGVDTGKPSRGEIGPQGATGPAGKTPVKGTDYFTDSEVREMASQAAGLVDLSGKQDVILASGASVGNLIKVKAVDANGKPTAWEIAEAGTDYAPAVMFVEVTGSSGSYETLVYPQQIWMIGRFKRSVFMYSDEDSMFYPLIASTQTQACFGGLDADGNAVRYIINSDRTVEKHLTPIGGKTYPVTLTVAGWNSSTKQQAVSFAAASSTETDHLLIPTPKLSDLTAYNNAGIICIGEDGTAQTLTFQCETVPTADITIYVTTQIVNYQEVSA